MYFAIVGVEGNSLLFWFCINTTLKAQKAHDSLSSYQGTIDWLTAGPCLAQTGRCIYIVHV